MDGSLGQHAVVLELGLAERGSVASNDDELGLAGAQALESRLVTNGHWVIVSHDLVEVVRQDITYPCRTS